MTPDTCMLLVHTTRLHFMYSLGCFSDNSWTCMSRSWSLEQEGSLCSWSGLFGSANGSPVVLSSCADPWQLAKFSFCSSWATFHSFCFTCKFIFCIAKIMYKPMYFNVMSCIITMYLYCNVRMCITICFRTLTPVLCWCLVYMHIGVVLCVYTLS